MAPKFACVLANVQSILGVSLLIVSYFWHVVALPSYVNDRRPDGWAKMVRVVQAV